MKKFFLAFVLGLLLATGGFIAMDYFGVELSDFLSKSDSKNEPVEQQVEVTLPERPANPIVGPDGRPFSNPFNAGAN